MGPEDHYPDQGLEPLTMVIYGASGDLTSRKLIPALYALYVEGLLKKPFRVIGSGRTPLDDGSWRERLRAAALAQTGGHLERWEEFASGLCYVQAPFDDRERFAELTRTVRQVSAATAGNLLHYLALPPSQYEPAADAIGRHGLARESTDGIGWSRLVVEKPFGRDVRSAVELNARLQKSFDEHQIFRIDHYLAKETVQNVLAFRLANAIFEPLWNRRYVDHVRITAAETLGVEGRASYYEEAGVLRDMIQNHLMQLLAVTAIEPPARWQSERVRDETVKLLRSLQPLPVDDDVYAHIVQGQYTGGEIDGTPVAGYRDEPGVDADSLTPTFARLKIAVDNWRWQGVPFFLTSGKRLPAKRTEAVIQFKRVPSSLFAGRAGDAVAPNSLTLGFQPEEVISLDFYTKAPGPTLRLRPASLRFDYSSGDSGPRLDGYAKVLLDCMAGDHTLFWRQDAVEESWRFIEPVLERCEGCNERRHNLHLYAAGTPGPIAASEMMSATGA